MKKEILEKMLNSKKNLIVSGDISTGKTENVVFPVVEEIINNNQSMLVLDSKEEYINRYYNKLKEKNYNIIILNLKDLSKSEGWNPLEYPYSLYKEGKTDEALDYIEQQSKIMFYEGTTVDPFWSTTASDFYTGLVLGLFEDGKKEEINLNSINFMSTVGEERRGTKTYIQEYFNLKGEASPAYIFASNTINAPNETKGGILSTFRQKIRLFSTKENLSEMLSYSDFDMRDIGNKKTAVFMIIHDEKKTYHGLMTIFIKQCYETLIDCAQANGGKLTYRTNFILDEFANMPPLKDVDSMVTAARSRAIRFSFIIQNFAQLNDVYGEEVAQVIKGNCGNLIYLISTELKALEEISKMCGEVKSKEKDKTASTPLVTVSDLQKLKLFQAIIIRWRKNPFKTDLAPDFKIDWGIERKDAVLPTREKTQIELFDVKKFVSEKKKEEAMNNPGMMGGMDNPFMGGGGFNPFMGANPFMGPRPNSSPMTSNQAPAPNPFMGGGEVTSKDIDDMVKEIEKKLQALDEEEKKENELKKQSENITEDKPVIKPIVEKKPSEDIDEIIKKLEKTEVPENNDESDGFTQEINLKDEPNTMLNVDKDSEIINNSVSDDDDYLDDFFDD